MTLRFLIVLVFLTGGRLKTRNMDLSNDARYRIGWLIGSLSMGFMAAGL